VKTSHTAGALTQIERINAIYKQQESKIMHGSKQQQAKHATLRVGKTKNGTNSTLCDLQQKQSCRHPHPCEIALAP
jgi:hypothetical protein